MKNGYQKRYAHCELRAEGDDGKLRGTAAVFDVETELVPGYFEVVRRSAFEKTIKDGFDTRALFNHNDEKVLGRVSSGTLKLWTDERGLQVEIDPPKWAEGIVESIRRGDISEMSFGFVPVQAPETRREDGTTLRELKETKLFDISPVTFPQYTGTEIQARSGLYITYEQAEELRSQFKPKEEKKEPISTGHSIALARRRLRLVELNL